MSETGVVGGVRMDANRARLNVFDSQLPDLTSDLVGEEFEEGEFFRWLG
jgi:hypothetical protein